MGRCSGCNWSTPSNPAPTPSKPTSPDYPMQSLCCDKAHVGKHTYFVLVDRFSNWPSVCQTTGGGAKDLISFLRKHFENFGVPESLKVRKEWRFDQEMREQALAVKFAEVE